MEKRLTAFKVPLVEIVAGDFVEVEGKWDPDYLLTPSGQKVSRVRVLGVVVSKYVSEDGSYSSITLDDSTATLRVKTWRADTKILETIEPGQLVDVVGKIRKYTDEIYLIPEIVVALDNPNWELLRRLELIHGRKPREFSKIVAPIPAEDETTEAPEAPAEESSPIEAKMKVLRTIESSPTGEEYGQIIKKTGLPPSTVDSVMKELLMDGEIFEPKSGTFKRLV